MCVSFAGSFTAPMTTAGKLLMTKCRKPSIPLVTSTHVDSAPLISTICLLLLKNAAIHSMCLIGDVAPQLEKQWQMRHGIKSF